MDNQKECNKCKKSDGELLKCSACGTVYYCSRDCQKNDWKDHKLNCKHVPAPKQEEPKKEPEVSKVDLYTKIKKAGDGNFSEIWHVEKKDTKQQFALKAINRQRLQQLHKENDVVMEVHCLTRLDSSEYAVKLYDRFKDDLNLYLVTDYVEGGELWDIVRSFGLIAQSLVKYYFCWLLKAVEFIHSKGIIHRDLKPENIMLDPNHKLRLIDFGTARDLENPQVKGAGNSARGKRIFEHFVGTPHYMAPECVRNKDSNLKSDVWSLGCILYQLIAGYPPFLGNSEYLVFQKSLEKEAVFDDFLFSSEAKELIKSMLERDFTKRISLEEVMRHPYFNGIDFKNLMSYEDAVKKIEPYEKLLIDIKEKLYEIEGKEENIKSVIEEGRKKLGESDFSEDLKAKCEKWIAMMEQQAKSHFGLADFTWHKE